MQVLAASNVSEGGAALANSVRDLASEARRLVTGPANPYETEALLRRIDTLQDEFEASPSSPIQNWLSSLRRQLQSL